MIAELIPIYRDFRCVASLNCARPPEKRRNAFGLIKRKRAIVVSHSSSSRICVFSIGVPGIGCNKLRGMDKIPSFCKKQAISIRSSIVSPMPIIPPQQMRKPIPGRYGWFPSSARSYAWNKVDGNRKGRSRYCSDNSPLRYRKAIGVGSGLAIPWRHSI